MNTLQKTDLIFNPTLDQFLISRQENFLTVLSGGNNNGKSLVLKWLKFSMGSSAYMIGTNRFYHVYHFNSSVRDPNQIQQYENQFQSNFSQENYNYEQNFIDLNQIIVNLGNQKREALFSLCGQLLNTTFSLRKVDEDNDLSVSYIDMGGQNLSVGSTGTRLLMTILGICMDERFKFILIDEPELGLSPKVQQVFSTLLRNTEMRTKYFAHLQKVVLATHSHIFLDRTDIQNNFIISKLDKQISLQQVQTLNDFHRLQFNLLGNDLETMFFPSAIVIVEGPTDYTYLDRVLQLRFPTNRITVTQSGGDVKRKVHALKEVFGDLSKSPLRNRLFLVVDSVHPRGLSAELQAMGVEADNIVIWDNNGVEYIYPASLLSDVYSCAPERVHELSITGDRITLNGVTKTKNELANEIVKRLDSAIILPPELEEKLLAPIKSAIN
ncbi:MAG: ATP-dependent nuclease [Aphanizomenon sp.]|jgi:predicted ATP-dependent endonuclease of OLD family|nr:ATP-binding protein [Aphanizomenon flos-aquae Clear-A1]